MTSPPDAHPWLIRPRAGNLGESRIRLFCLPYAGVGASVFHPWAQGLPPDIDLCAVQLPGRENRLRERPFTRLLEAVEALAVVLRPSLDVPFALFGHSMGALIAFELARQLQKRYGQSPAILFVSGRQAPQVQETTPPFFDWPEAEFVAEVRRRYQGLSESVMNNPELRRIFIPILRADFELLSTYVYSGSKPLACPITALGGYQDNLSREDLTAWKELTAGVFRLYMFAGNHFFLQTARPRLLQVLTEELELTPRS